MTKQEFFEKLEKENQKLKNCMTQPFYGVVASSLNKIRQWVKQFEEPKGCEVLQIEDKQYDNYGFHEDQYYLHIKLIRSNCKEVLATNDDFDNRTISYFCPICGAKIKREVDNGTKI